MSPFIHPLMKYNPHKYADNLEQHRTLMGGICKDCLCAAKKLCPKCGHCERCGHKKRDCPGEYVRTE